MTCWMRILGLNLDLIYLLQKEFWKKKKKAFSMAACPLGLIANSVRSWYIIFIYAYNFHCLVVNKKTLNLAEENRLYGLLRSEDKVILFLSMVVYIYFFICLADVLPCKTVN